MLLCASRKLLGAARKLLGAARKLLGAAQIVLGGLQNTFSALSRSKGGVIHLPAHCFSPQRRRGRKDLIFRHGPCHQHSNTVLMAHGFMNKKPHFYLIYPDKTDLDKADDIFV
jgi:hypothetical protein